MKKIIITLALAFIGTFSYGQSDKKIVRVKDGKKDTLLVRERVVTDTISRQDYNKEIARFEQALQAGKESIAIQTKLNEYYLSEIKRLKAEKKKTD